MRDIESALKVHAGLCGASAMSVRTVAEAARLAERRLLQGLAFELWEVLSLANHAKHHGLDVFGSWLLASAANPDGRPEHDNYFDVDFDEIAIVFVDGCPCVAAALLGRAARPHSRSLRRRARPDDPRDHAAGSFSAAHAGGVRLRSDEAGVLGAGVGEAERSAVPGSVALRTSLSGLWLGPPCSSSTTLIHAGAFAGMVDRSCPFGAAAAGGSASFRRQLVEGERSTPRGPQTSGRGRTAPGVPECPRPRSAAPLGAGVRAC